MEFIKLRLHDFGAKLLSEQSLAQALRDPKDKFHYACSKGHENHKTVAGFKRSKICRTCSRRDPEETKRRLLEIVEKRGGKIDIKQYKRADSKITIMCVERHKWEGTPSSILSGNWCSRCMNTSKEQARERLVKIVEDHKGKVDISEYKSSESKMTFICQLGHEWKTKAGHIIGGGWCPFCANVSSDQAKEKLLLVVQMRKGKVDMNTYSNSKEKMQFECDQGHGWKTTPTSIIGGSWCKRCASKNRIIPTLEEFGRLLSDAVKGHCGSFDAKTLNKKRMEFTCRVGHTWSSAPWGIIKGSWCSHCRGNSDTAKTTLEEYVRLKKGSVDMSTYQGVGKKMLFTCQYNHQWSTTPGNLVGGKSWCPHCSGVSKESAIEKLERIVKEKGGKCQLSEYKKSTTPMTFICSEKHEWKARPSSINNGSWCSRCSNISSEQSKERLVEYVEKKKGKVDISKYKNSKTKLLFICEKKHEWSALPGNVLSGSWCPACCQSRGENELKAIFYDLKIKFSPQEKLKGSRKNVKGRDLSADLFLEKENLIIEFDGEQHFTQSWCGRKRLEFRENDLRKNAWCRDHGVHLLRIPWWTIDLKKTILDALAQFPRAELLVPPENYFDQTG